MKFIVIDALARAGGERYSTHDVVGAGPRIVAGIIYEKGFKVDLKAYEAVLDDPSLLKRYDYILISAMSQDKGALERIIKIAKKNNPKSKIVVGGPISFEYKDILKKYSEIDYIIIGEAEIPLTKFLEEINSGNPKFKEVPSLAFRNNNEVYLTSPPVHTPREIISMNKPWVFIENSYPNYRIYRYYVEVVRGCSNFYRPLLVDDKYKCVECMVCRNAPLKYRLKCPANIPPGCGFCSVPNLFGPARTRSIDNIVEEISSLIKHGARRIVLSAPDFLDYGRDLLVSPDPLTDPCEPLPNLEYIQELFEAINDLKTKSNHKVVFMIENIKACLVNEEVAKLLGKYLSGTTIHIGLETADYGYNLKVLGKPIGLKSVIKAIKLLRKYGLRPYVYIMYGLPYMNKKTYLKTIKSIRILSKLGVEKITLYKFTPLPHTAFEHISLGIEKYKGLINKLKYMVNKFNYSRKKKSLLGKRITVFLLFSRGKYYGYPFYHGPTVFVKGIKSPNFSGCLAEVEIYDVAPRFVWGRFIRIIEC
ncbi:MAG: B12-binding domain-containing radical SAM protein [Staphylothermus sp.]|nr:B12-binding domain-containing radical SAM protein [Staphylothermus sp.]